MWKDKCSTVPGPNDEINVGICLSDTFHELCGGLILFPLIFSFLSVLEVNESLFERKDNFLRENLWQIPEQAPEGSRSCSLRWDSCSQSSSPRHNHRGKCPLDSARQRCWSHIWGPSGNQTRARNIELMLLLGWVWKEVSPQFLRVYDSFDKLYFTIVQKYWARDI